MRIHTKAVYSWNTKGGFRLISEEGFDYIGPIADCKGASKDEKAMATSQRAFYTTLTESYKTQFAGQASILNALQAAWEPILAAGPGQEGFTPAQKTALLTQATEGTAAEFQKAKIATKGEMATRGGGTERLPSGYDEKVLRDITSAEAATQAGQRLGIQQASWERGYQNWLGATSALSGTASIYQPVGFAGEATLAGKLASESTKTASRSGWAATGGALGGIAAAFAGGLGEAVGGGGGKGGGGKK